ncbi:MAG: alpha/beta hydrolase [Thermosynechococcaceae cyanobacterium]
MSSINVMGVQHAYELTPPIGTGPVLVFVHGWLLSRNYWRPLIQQLSSTYQCLAYDLRGFGESSLPTVTLRDKAIISPLSFGEMRIADRLDLAVDAGMLGNGQPRYTPAAYGQDLIILLKQLGISRAWIIGHSLGGSIALWAAAFAPQVIEGVVCLNSGGGIYVKEAFERFRQAGQQMLWFRPAWLPYVPYIEVAFSRMMVAQPLEQRWGRQRVIDFVAAHPEAARRSLLDSTLPEQVHLLPQVVAHLSQPVLFLAGQQDPVMELKYVYHLASFHHSFQGGHPNVIEIPDCGHMGMLEQPTAIAHHIQDLLAESVPNSPYRLDPAARDRGSPEAVAVPNESGDWHK